MMTNNEDVHLFGAQASCTMAAAKEFLVRTYGSGSYSCAVGARIHGHAETLMMKMMWQSALHNPR